MTYRAFKNIILIKNYHIFGKKNYTWSQKLSLLYLKNLVKIPTLWCRRVWSKSRDAMPETIPTAYICTVYSVYKILNLFYLKKIQNAPFADIKFYKKLIKIDGNFFLLIFLVDLLSTSLTNAQYWSLVPKYRLDKQHTLAIINTRDIKI